MQDDSKECEGGAMLKPNYFLLNALYNTVIIEIRLWITKLEFNDRGGNY